MAPGMDGLAQRLETINRVQIRHLRGALGFPRPLVAHLLAPMGCVNSLLGGLRVGVAGAL